jgi:hypothetical protein
MPYIHSAQSLAWNIEKEPGKNEKELLTNTNVLVKVFLSAINFFGSRNQ